jgi:hypothetical protein
MTRKQLPDEFLLVLYAQNVMLNTAGTLALHVG